MLVMAGPYILFGFLIAGLIHTFVSPAQIVSLLGRRNWKSVIMASLCGVPLPLCSCSVLPTAAALREKGASRGATSAFLISTPETGVDSIAMTYGIMNLTMAILRPVSAFLTAFVSGVFVNAWGEREEEKANAENAAPAQKSCCCSAKNAQTADSCSIPAPKSPWWRSALRYAFGDLSDNLAHWLGLGLILSGIIAACIPESVFSGWAGQGVSSLFLMLLIGAPMYICASASTPIAAVMIAKGLSPGAALVFLLAGPATNIGSMPVLFKIIGRRSTAIYLASIGAVSLAIGFCVNLFYQYQSIKPQMAFCARGEEGGSAIGVLAALLLMALLIKGIALRPVPAEWRKFNDRLAQITGHRLTWESLFVIFVVILVLSLLLP